MIMLDNKACADVSDIIMDQVLGVAVGQAASILLSQVFSWN